MPSFDPDAYLKKKKDFNPDEYLKKKLTPYGVDQEPVKPKVVYEPKGRPATAAAYALGEGVTLDNLDEIIASGRSLFSPEKYDELVAEQESFRKKLEEENPTVSAVSKFGSYAIPGMAATKLLKPATALGRLGIEAGIGATQGLGTAESMEEVPGSMAIGAGAGVLGQGIIEKAAPLARKGIGKASDTFSNIFLNTPTEVSQALRKDPRYLDNVMEIPEIADEAVRRLGRTKGQVRGLSEQALETLRPEPIQNKMQILQRFDELPEKYGIRGTEDFPESKAILNEIELARNAIINAQTETDIRNILRRLGDKANFTTPSGDAINAIRKEMRSTVSQGLKEVNPQYAQAMEPLAQQTRALERGTKILSPEVEDGRLTPRDITSSRVESLMRDLGKDKKIRSRQAIEEIYPGFEEELRRQQIARRAEGGVQSGSRNIMGTTLGVGGLGEGLNYATGLNVPPGVISGGAAMAGSVIDKYGRTLGAKIAKAGGRAGRFLNKYGHLFKEGTNRELTHSILMGTDPEYKKAFMELGDANFSDPATSANLVGSALLGSDLTRMTAGVGAGIGSAMEGGSFQEGMESRYKQLGESQGQLEGVLSMLGTALPTGRAGGVASKIIRGAQSLDEIMSETGKQKNAPNLMNITMPSGDKFGSRIKDAEKAGKKLHEQVLPSGNIIKVPEGYAGNHVIKGWIEHPSLGKHTTFEFKRDKDGLWSLDHNFRNDLVKDDPLAKGSSTELRNLAAKLLGGIGSDQQGRTSKIAQRSYFRDKEALPTSPDLRSGPDAKFFTPGSKAQKKKFEEAFQKSYGEKIDKEKIAEGSTPEAQERLRTQKDFELQKNIQKRIMEAMNDPRYADIHRTAEKEAQRDIEQHIRDIKATGRATLIPYFSVTENPRLSQLMHLSGNPEKLIRAQYVLNAYEDNLKRIAQAEQANRQRRIDQSQFLNRLRQEPQFEFMRQTARDIIEQGMQNRIRSIEAGDEVARVRGDYQDLGTRAYDMSLLSELDKASPLERDQAKLNFLVESKKLRDEPLIERRLDEARTSDRIRRAQQQNVPLREHLLKAAKKDIENYTPMQSFDPSLYDNERLIKEATIDELKRRMNMLKQIYDYRRKTGSSPINRELLNDFRFLEGINFDYRMSITDMDIAYARYQAAKRRLERLQSEGKK